jgi:hypothetical protein
VRIRKGDHSHLVAAVKRDSAVTIGANYARESEQVTRLTDKLPKGSKFRVRLESEAMVLCEEACKSCAHAGLENGMMQSSSRRRLVTGMGRELSTGTSLFSTRYAHALQVRDLVFVKRTQRSTYRRTGADSRVGLASAPAFPMQVLPVSFAFPNSASRVPRQASRPSLSRSSVAITV